jgi:Glycosyl transferase family 2
MHHSQGPLVSVITATRNRPSLLRLALSSIAEQTYRNIEVIVVDDGSDEHVREEYKRTWSVLDSRFCLYYARPPGVTGGGPSAARNLGIRQARGEFVAFLDDDDRWLLPDHLSVAVEGMNRCEGDYFFCNMQGTKRGVVHTPDWFPRCPWLVSGHRVIEEPAVHEVSLINVMRAMRHHLIHPDQSVIRRRLLIEINGFHERISFSEDLHLMFRVADRARRILYRPDVGVAYRFPEGNSVSLQQDQLDRLLQLVFLSQHARAVCKNRCVRRCARAREGWTLRQLSEETLSRAGLPGEALRFAFQSLATFPTVGVLLFLVRTGRQVLTRGIRARMRHGLRARTN